MRRQVYRQGRTCTIESGKCNRRGNSSGQTSELTAMEVTIMIIGPSLQHALSTGGCSDSGCVRDLRSIFINLDPVNRHLATRRATASVSMNCCSDRLQNEYRFFLGTWDNDSDRGR